MQNVVRKGGDAGDGCKCKQQQDEQEPGRAALISGGGLGDAECLEEDRSQGFEQVHELMLRASGAAVGAGRLGIEFGTNPAWGLSIQSVSRLSLATGEACVYTYS